MASLALNLAALALGLHLLDFTMFDITNVMYWLFFLTHYRHTEYSLYTWPTLHTNSFTSSLTECVFKTLRETKWLNKTCYSCKLKPMKHEPETGSKNRRHKCDARFWRLIFVPVTYDTPHTQNRSRIHAVRINTKKTSEK